MNVKEALQTGFTILQDKKITSARLDAEVILMHVLKISKEELYTYPEKKLKTKQQDKYLKLIKKRSTFYPVAYITKHKEFFGLNFHVNSNVLIPRPDTELLVTEAIKIIKNKKLKKIADIGTGSGAIPISIAKNTLNTQITATDISKKALVIAKQNAKNHQININFLHGDLLTPIKNKKINLITANLPYLDIDYKNLLKTSCTKSIKYEPNIALYAGSDGLDEYRRFFTQIIKLKHKPTFILIEHGHAQTKELKKIIKKHLPFSRVQTVKDLCGLDRVTKIKVLQK